jgi:hypothetical protein
MSTMIWTKEKVQNARERGVNIDKLFENLDNYVYLERYYISYKNNYMYTLYTSSEVIKDLISRDNNDYVLIHNSQFDKVFNILSEVSND